MAKDDLSSPSLQPPMVRSFWIGSVCAVASLFAAPVAAETDKVQIFNTQIMQSEVEQAQQGWCDALLTISAAYQTGGFEAAKVEAAAVIDTAYAFDIGPVAFKPTYTTGPETFRTTREGAIAYFVGPDPSIALFGSDQGFATYRHWVDCEVDNYVIQLMGNTANTMGLFRFKDSNGQRALVEKTLTYLRDRDGQLEIVLHHSSAPFDAR